METLVVNIQKFSLHDGTGIRTTVFFKGCPLKCLWCANPESQNAHSELAYQKNKCMHCLACINVCPQNCIEYKETEIVIDKDRCNLCFNCVNTCSTHAIYKEGKYYTPEELAYEILKDNEFYKTSGGGLTISGGEPFLHENYLRALLSIMEKENIHVVAETCGFVNASFFKEIIMRINMLYFDLKHPNSAMHKEYTGVDNLIILKNLKYAIECKRDVTVRIPVIMGFNSNAHEEYAKLLKELNVKKIHLLPFHNYGAAKYKSLNMLYKYEACQNMTKEELIPMENFFKKEGFTVQIGG